MKLSTSSIGTLVSFNWPILRGADAFLGSCRHRSGFRGFHAVFTKAGIIRRNGGHGSGAHGLGVIDDKVDAAFSVYAGTVQFHGLPAQVVDGIFHRGVFKGNGGNDDALELHQVGGGAADSGVGTRADILRAIRNFNRNGAFPDLVHFRQHGAAGFVVRSAVIGGPRRFTVSMPRRAATL